MFEWIDFTWSRKEFAFNYIKRVESIPCYGKINHDERDYTIAFGEQSKIATCNLLHSTIYCFIII